MKTRIVLTLVLTATLTGCGSDVGSGKTTVVAAFYPLAFAAEQIGGDRILIRNLTAPGVEPHDLELSGGDIRTIADADLVLYLGHDFQPTLEDAIRSTSAKAVDLLEAPRAGDAHIWLDPLRYGAIAARIGHELDRPAAAGAFENRLKRLDREFRRGLSGCRRQEFVTSHAAFGYLAEHYGLEQVAITGVTPEAEPTPRDLENVVRKVREVGATTVFFETLVSPRLAQTVAREVGAKTAVLDPIEGLTETEIEDGEDYFSVMRENLAALRKALECR